MDELGKGLAIALNGPEASDALARFRGYMVEWNIALPSAQPLVLDFGLGRFSKTGLIEVWIANELEAGYCGKYMFLFAEQTCPSHCHHDKVETFFIVRGRVQINYGERSMTLKPGDTLKVETGIYHSFTAIDEPALLLELSKPCLIEDNYFQNPSIPIGGNYTES